MGFGRFWHVYAPFASCFWIFLQWCEGLLDNCYRFHRLFVQIGARKLLAIRMAHGCAVLLFSLVVMVEGSVAAPPATNGPKSPTVQPAWTYDGNYPIVTDPAVSADGTTGFYSTSASAVFALDFASGSTLWSIQLSNPTSGSPALTPDGRLLVLGCGNNVTALASNNGSVVWTARTGNIVSATPIMSATKSSTYVGSADGNMYAVDTTNGHVMWNSSSAGACSSLFGPWILIRHM
jgi:outer membrane protein assembly factor BamB